MLIKAQESEATNWVYMAKEKTTTLEFTKSETLSVDKFSFKAIWSKELNLPDIEYPYGGISELNIYKGKTHVQTITNIVDGIDLGYIDIKFYDYNMDGYLDFSIPINCGKLCYSAYYLFNPKAEKFEHSKDWDYLRIQKLDKGKKRILSMPEGTARSGKKMLYQVKGLQIQKIKTIVY